MRFENLNFSHSLSWREREKRTLSLPRLGVMNCSDSLRTSGLNDHAIEFQRRYKKLDEEEALKKKALYSLLQTRNFRTGFFNVDLHF